LTLADGARGKRGRTADRPEDDTGLDDSLKADDIIQEYGSKVGILERKGG
jgi:hypothetical protein